jgi:hypothetical protein
MSIKPSWQAEMRIVGVALGARGADGTPINVGDALADDQTGARPLGLVFGMQLGRRQLGTGGAHSREWRHDNAVRQSRIAHLHGLEQGAGA